LTAPGQSGFAWRCAAVSRDVAAVTNLLEHVAGLLRQVFHVAGWLVLLWGAAVLPFQAHPSPVHLIAPGAGLLAVVQGILPAWRRRRVQSAVVLPGNEPTRSPGDPSVEADMPESASRDVAYGGFVEGVEQITQA
jgi:hypothetical protein